MTGCDESVTEANIPAEIDGVAVTSIGACSFYDHDNLISVSIPDGVTTIGGEAFSECTNLENVTIPDSVVSMEWSVFLDCQSLTRIAIPAAVTTIGSDSFACCPSLTEIVVDPNNTVYCDNDGVLFNKNQTVLLAYPNARAASYTIPDSVTSIGNHAFMGCSDLTSVRLPDCVNEIGDYAFYGCSSLTSLRIPDSVSDIRAFAFCECSNLKHINLPAGLTSVQYGAFCECSSLTRFNIPSNVTIIAPYAFSDCTSLTQIRIPGSVTDIQFGAFDACTSLTDIYYTGTAAQWTALQIDNEDGDNSDLLSATIHYNSTGPEDSSFEFDPTLYRAQVLQYNSEPFVQLINEDVKNRAPSEELIKELQKSGFEDAVVGWEGLELISDTLEDVTAIPEFLVQPKDMYSAVILTALEASVSYDIISDEYEEILKNGNTFLSLAKDHMKNSYGLDILNDNAFRKMTKEEQEELDKFSKEYLGSTLGISGQIMKGTTIGIDALGSMEEYFEKIASYAVLTNTCESMKEVLRAAYNDSKSSGNLLLQLALQDCVEIMDSSSEAIMARIVEDSFAIAGKETAKYLISELLWNQVRDTLYLTHPAVALLHGAYKSGKFVSNLLVDTDDTTEQYLKMCAITDMEHLVNGTYNRLKASFVQKETTDSAAVYLSALDLVYSLRDEDCVRVYEFVDILDKTVINSVYKLFGVDTYADAKSYFKQRQVNYFTNHENALTNWILYLEEDYPNSGLYEKYQALEDSRWERTLAKKFVAACPIDVYVYDKDNTVVASVVDGRISRNTDDVMIAIMGDEKVVWFYEGADYRIEYVGTGSGTMDVDISEFDSDGACVRTVGQDDIPVTRATTYTTNVDDRILAQTPYQLVNDTTGDAVSLDYDSLLTEEAYTVSVTSGSLMQNGETLLSTTAKPGETLELHAYVPEGYTFIKWVSSNQEPIFEDAAQPSTTFTMPDEEIEIQAVLTPTGWQTPFLDLLPTDYFYAPVRWAVENGITTGVSATAFAPMDACSRAQIVTFLWRAAGEPEVTFSNGFADVAADAYYAKAVAWAVEKGITTGTSDTTFSPDAPCTRAQAVTFLWRCAGEPEAETGSAFSDVIDKDYYAKAVAWAAEQGITTGTTDTTFSPGDPCTRAQIVSFLYRDRVETA